MRQYSIEPRTKKIITKNKKKLDTGLDPSKKVKEFIGNKIGDAVTKSNIDKILKQEPVEEIIIPPEKRGETLKKLRRIL